MRSALSRIHLVDKCLILFMAVLLAQSAFSLFFHNRDTSEITNIDVVVRTSSASIFGYFLSANFIRHDSSGQDPAADSGAVPELSSGSPPPDPAPRNRIGFEAAPSESGPVTRGMGNIRIKAEKEVLSANRLQIIAATAIGVFCLLSLLLLRNVAEWNALLASSTSIAATVAQFRDFVSGCVGFLIGCPTSQAKSS